MSWLRENSLPAGVVAMTILLCGTLTFLMLQAMTRYHETRDAYQQSVRRLHVLQNRSPFPNAENLEKSRGLLEQYKKGFESLRAQVADMQVPIDPGIQPQKFQDDLRTAVNRVVEKAAAAGVELPKGFYLGFSQYANSLPNEQVAPALAQQLAIIEKLVTNLIDLKIQAINSLNRHPLPEETAPAARKTDEGPKGAEGNAEGLKLFPIDLTFTAEQGKLRVAFNSLLSSDQFLIVRSLAFQSTARVGPPISRQNAATRGQQALPGRDSANSDAPSAGSPSDSQTNSPPTLNVILGREQVKASLRIEIVNLPTPPSVKQ